MSTAQSITAPASVTGPCPCCGSCDGTVFTPVMWRTLGDERGPSHEEYAYNDRQQRLAEHQEVAGHLLA
jgi:hypothetical protein